jgi:hypothetical protein
VNEHGQVASSYIEMAALSRGIEDSSHHLRLVRMKSRAPMTKPAFDWQLCCREGEEEEEVIDWEAAAGGAMAGGV